MLAPSPIAEEFRRGCDHYFDTLDGTAATVEQFIASFEASSGQDLSQFMRWYEQAGTPHVKVSSAQTPEGLKVTFQQALKATPGQEKKEPQVIPIKWQVIGENGVVSDPQLTVLDSLTKTVTLPSPQENISLSVLQDFSAPVILHSDQNSDDALRLMANDPNAFNRWEAGQALARNLMGDIAKAIETGSITAPNKALKGYSRALRDTLLDNDFNNNFKALALTIPSNMEVLQSLPQADPIAVNLAGNWLNRAIADEAKTDLIKTYHSLQDDGPFNPDANAAGRRALKNRCLSLLASRQDAVAAPLAISQFNTATNMTDELSALMILEKLGGRRVNQFMEDFYTKWKDKPLVIDKWFAVQAGRKHPEGVTAVRNLTKHSAFDPRNPNRVRALVGGFAMNNPHLFHHNSGAGYDFFTEQVLDMDSRNPSVAARLLGVYEIWRKLDTDRQEKIKGQLRYVINSKPSKNVLEIAAKTLGE